MLMMNTGHSQVGPAVDGLVADLRPRHRQQEPARLRRALPGRADDRRAAAVEQRVPAGDASGHVHLRSSVERPDQIIGKDFDPKKLVTFINNQEFTLAEQRRELDLLETARQAARERQPTDPQLEAAIKSMEVAYRMQTEAPEVFDIRKESEATLEMYGPGSTARGCLMAVRLVENGVRMVQVYYAKGDPWDPHGDIQLHRKNAKDSDQPFAAVIKDLKSRGLFKDTLVVCGSEFGRTPVCEVAAAAARRRTAATTIRSASRCGWPAAASRAA